MRRSSTYPGGIEALLTQYETRRDSFDYAAGEALHPLDTDLGALKDTPVADPDTDPNWSRPFRSSYHRKGNALRKEFIGASELCVLHGMVIAHLRKRDWPQHAPALFQRLWAEEATHLLTHLDARWLVSAVTTFGDHGANATQRATGLAMTALFGTMKLYESERLYSGRTPDTAFPLDTRKKAILPLEMDSYSLTSGGLDVNLIARLWREAEGDPVLAPLAHRLLSLLIHDDRTVFRRLMTMRTRKKKLDKHKARASKNVAPVASAAKPVPARDLRWGIVSTIKAPLPQIARFAAYHLSLGADALHLHFDQPDSEAEVYLSRHPAIRITQCDDAYWRRSGKNRMDAHQLRQAFNATRTLKDDAQDLHLLAHIDVDEFLLCSGPMRNALATMPPAAAFARIPPAEALAPETGPPTAFKLSHVAAGKPKTVLQDIYPTFGLHLYGGFLSHTSGKVIARTGIADTRLGIHTLKYAGEEASNSCTVPGLYLAHLHAPDWDTFKRHLAFRLDRGSYRKREHKTEMGQGEILRFLADEEGDEGLRALFDEVCADTPRLREALRQEDMLIEKDLDLDTKVRQIFGELP